MCFNSKNLYNYANYILRQAFINKEKQPTYPALNKELKHRTDYVSCMSQPANCVLRRLFKVWKSFYVACKDFTNNPNKYLGAPHPPKYLKKNGRYVWEIPNNSCYVKNSYLQFRVKFLQSYNWNIKVQGRLLQVRFVPKGTCYIMEVVTETEKEIDFSEVKNIASIDLGVNNFATITNNIGLEPIIINGKGIKSINQFYNKRRADIQNKLGNQKWSRKLDGITFKRSMRIKNFMHNASRYVINYCFENKIDTIICGKNNLWKNGLKMCNKVNQKFQYIPYEVFLNQLEYKCVDAGINFIKTDESYTSGTSFLENELPVKENYDKKRRIKRGMFKSIKGIINSDVNGSYQIMRKVFPDAISYGIEVCLTPKIVNVVKI